MIYRFDDFEIDTELVTLTKNEISIDIEPKLFSLLVYFCENTKRAISRDELITTVWQGRFVSEAAINRAVGQLRKLIEQDTSHPMYIKTVSKVGYKFVADISVYSIHLLAKKQSTSSNKNPNNKRTISKVLLATGFLIICAIAISIYLNQSSFIGNTVTLKVAERKPITTSNNISFNPYFDQNNNELLYLFKDNPQSLVQIKRLNQQHKTHLITDDEHYYTDVVSLDRERVIAARLTNLKDRNCEIVIINKINHYVEKVVDCRKSIINNLVFEKETNKVYYRFRNTVSAPYSIYSISLASLRIQQLSRPISTGNGLGHITFSLSPDKNEIAIVEYKSGDNDELQLINLDTQSIAHRQLIPKKIRSLLWWSPSTLLMNNTESMYRIDLQNLTTIKIKSTSGIGRFSRKGDSNALLFEKSSVQSNLKQIELNKKGITNLTNLIGLNGKPSLANHSDTMIFHSQTAQYSKLLIRQHNGEITESNFPEKIRYVATLDWSNDDSQIIASINDTPYLLNINTMRWQELSVGFNSIHYVSFIDNNHALFSAEKDGDWHLWSLDLLTNQTSLLTDTEGYSGQVHNDDLFYTKFSTAGLFHKNLTTQKETLLINDFPVVNWNDWEVINEKIVYTQGKQLKQYDLKNKQFKVIHQNTTPLRYCRTAPSISNFVCEFRDQSISNIWQAKIKSAQRAY